MELIKDNHMYGTGNGPTWQCTMGAPNKKVGSYYAETVNAFEYIYANKTGKFQVLYSGGADSQYVCEVLLKLGMPFEAVVIHLTTSDGQVLNDDDIKYAYDFCESKGIKLVKYNLDFEKFVDSGKILEIAIDCQCSKLTLPATMHTVGQLDGYVIVGSGDPYLRYKSKENMWGILQSEWEFSWINYYNNNRINGTPFILSYTSEMLLAYLLDDSINKLGTGQFPGKLGSYSTKSRVYNNQSGFNITAYDYVKKNRIKLTGYEKIQYLPIMDHPNIKKFTEFLDIWDGEHFEEYTKLVERLSLWQ